MDLAEIRDFAVAAHGTQQYGAQPYSVHLDAVAKLAAPFGETAQAIAYLHDVVEDTAVTETQVRQRYGDFVARCVAILTDEAGPDRKTRKVLTYAKMKQVVGEEELALVVKTADRLANVRACVNDNNQRLLGVYREEHPSFCAAVFRPKLADSLWQELNQLIDKPS